MVDKIFYQSPVKKMKSEIDIEKTKADATQSHNIILGWHTDGARVRKKTWARRSGGEINRRAININEDMQ